MSSQGIYLNLYNEVMLRYIEVCPRFSSRRHIINSVSYADDTVFIIDTEKKKRKKNLIISNGKRKERNKPQI